MTRRFPSTRPRPARVAFGAGKFAYERAGGRFNQFSRHVTKLIGEGVAIEAAKQTLYDEVLKNFDSFLAARQQEPVKKPFCYWFGPTNVHRKWVQGSGQALWRIEPESLRGKLPPFLPDVPEVREDVADYLGEVQAFDAALGLLLKRLEAIGELDNTLVVVSGDHGPPGFPHGKCNLYDFGSSVSLAVRWGGTRGGRVGQAEERLLSKALSPFNVSTRNNALEMARLYAVLHCFENEIRTFVRETLEEKEGGDWANKLPAAAKKFAESRQKTAFGDTWRISITAARAGVWRKRRSRVP